jgi:molybdopterin converting factor subunit 1
MLIKMKYFASLKDSTNKSCEELSTNSNTANELFEELNNKYEFEIPKEFIKVAINEKYSHMDSPLNENDTVVFIPPVAGG